jgi:glycosyltransferase involved in cell wall biosynthesis
MPTIKEIAHKEIVTLQNTKNLKAYSRATTVYKLPSISDKTLFITGCVHNHSGYDCLVRQMVTGFVQANINFRINNNCHADEFKNALHKKEDQWEIIIKTPASLFKYNVNKKSILIAMWEADYLDPAWVSEMNKAFAIITPSTWSKASFIKHGVTVPIHVVPLGYDPLVFNPQSPYVPEVPFRAFDSKADPGSSLTLTKPCTFGVAAALGDGGIRKNVHYTIECFQKAFQYENVRLKIKLGAKDNLGINDNRIEITKATLTEHELADWYRSLDAYVHLSAAEGWGLHVVESMACGVPAISTTYSSMQDYMSEEIGIVVDHEEIDVDNWVYKGKQCKPVEESVISALQWANTHQEEMKLKGEWAALKAKNYPWKIFGKNLLDILHVYDIL